MTTPPGDDAGRGFDDGQGAPDRDKLAANVASAKIIGKLAAEAAIAKGIKAVVFDRGGARYHWSEGQGQGWQAGAGARQTGDAGRGRARSRLEILNNGDQKYCGRNHQTNRDRRTARQRAADAAVAANPCPMRRSLTSRDGVPGVDREGRVHQPFREGRQGRTPIQFQRAGGRGRQEGKRRGRDSARPGKSRTRSVAAANWPAIKWCPCRSKDATIPHEVYCAYGGAKVLLRPPRREPASLPARPCARFWNPPDVKDVLSKSLGSKNAANVVKATLKALLSLRLREDIYQGRGLQIKKVETPQAPEAAPATA